MEAINIKDFKTLINTIYKKPEYEEVLQMAYDFIYQEKPRYIYSNTNELFALFFNFLMVNLKPIDFDNFKIIISQIKEVIEKNDITIENLIYILFYNQIESLGIKYNKGLISELVYKEQLKKFNNGNFDINKLLYLIEHSKSSA